ncbi:hypothetical protein F383_21232 [Gossypium arboreum]|uniref:Uncharacterized protein n=1 Tax=Gossypium arboreum TaxID=29729 RepID=A0A0B0NRM3_GOSAR|nr:hypothetical protein F383_21232 [Gossypium arboreum]
MQLELGRLVHWKHRPNSF